MTLSTLTTWLLALFLFLMVLMYKDHRDGEQERTVARLTERILTLAKELARDTLQLRAEKQNVNVMFVTPMEFKNLEKLEGRK